MGKGDKKTKRGKIIMGSYGVRRPKKQKNILAATRKIADKQSIDSKDELKETLKEKKKPAAKKTTIAKETESAPTTAKKKTTKTTKKETKGDEE